MAMINSINFGNDTHSFTLPYGVCSTAAGTAAKTVTVDNFSLETGATVIVKFTYENTVASPTLNVNSTGAKPIYRYGTTAASTGASTAGWRAGAIQLFTYDGTGWCRDFWENSTYSNASLGQGYATCTTAEATTAKVGTLSSYSLSTGGIVAVKFTYAVPASSTLNINSKGAKNIYYRGAAITAGIINAGDTATFIYDGTNYHLLSVDIYSNATTSADGLMSATDKKYLDSVRGSYNMGDMTNKTITDFKNTFDTWLESNYNVVNASAHFSSSTTWITKWNQGDSAAITGNSTTFSITVISRSSNKNYTQLRIISYYDKTIYYVAKVDGVWKSIHQAVFTDDLPSAATTSAAGLMSAADKTKLDGIATGANKYTHPSYTAKSSGLYKVTVDASGHVSAATAVAKADITGLGIPASDTKNTAGSTDSSSKLFLIGATSQAANPQTYSHDTAYVGTDGCLYSNSKKVSVEGHTHSGYAPSYQYSTTDLTAGTSELATGTLYFVYE